MTTSPTQLPPPHEIAPDLFAFDGDLSLLGMQFGHRMTVVRLASGGLWVHSPVQLSAGVLQALGDLGSVEHLVAPSIMHDLYLGEWLEALDEARSFAPPRMREVHPEWSFDADLGAIPPPDWDAELPHVFLRGAPKLDEHVFLHRATGSLIVADLLFNLTHDQRPLPGLLMSLFGARGPIRTGRLFRAMIRDRSAFRASIEQLLEWDFERVVVGHGEVIGPDQIPAVRTHLQSL